jgi:hypothetical protein
VSPCPAWTASPAELDRGDAQGERRIDGCEIGVDEQADADARLPEPADRVGQFRVWPVSGPEVEPALGGDFFPAFRDERGLMRGQLQGERHDIRCRGELQVEHRGDGAREPPHVVILNVAPILPEVDRDSVGAAGFGARGGRDRVGFVGSAGLPHGGDMIDVHVQPHARLPRSPEVLTLRFRTQPMCNR